MDDSKKTSRPNWFVDDCGRGMEEYSLGTGKDAITIRKNRIAIWYRNSDELIDVDDKFESMGESIDDDFSPFDSN